MIIEEPLKFEMNQLLLPKENYQVYLDKVLNTKPSNNGYYLMIIEDVKIVAEIKCNKPINYGYVFGAEQKKGITNDIRGLLEGTTKVRRKVRL